MACKHPITAWVDGTTDNGKRRLRFAPKRDRPVEFQETVQVPCGQCVACRLDYSRQWADRCMLELQYHDSAYFVTLTYNDAHVPMSWSSDPATGEIGSRTMTLFKRDFQLFMKRLRKAFPDDHIRYFMCGEYGSKYFRPHYHAILFGLHLTDLELFKKSQTGFPIFTSEALEKCWIDTDIRFPRGHPDRTYSLDQTEEEKLLGFVSVQSVTWETCAYTARYILKKQKGENSVFYDIGGIVPEFTLMSRKPGIARQFYEDHKEDLYSFDYVSIKLPSGGRKIRPSRYYDQLYDIDDPDAMEKVKNDRKYKSKLARDAKLANTSLSETELLAVEERNIIAKVSKLRRSFEDG